MVAIEIQNLPPLCMLSHFSHVRLFVTLWAVAYQAPLSMGFSRQEYWGGLSRPLPRDLPSPGIEPIPLTSLALAGGFFTISATWETHMEYLFCASPVNKETKGMILALKEACGRGRHINK